jgi:colanic acid/amylovoran biosynthesis protein
MLMADRNKVKILISHVYSKYNNGDAAILSAQISLMRKTFNGPEIRIHSIEPNAYGSTFDGVLVEKSLSYGSIASATGRLIKVAVASGMVIYTTLWACAYRLAKIKLPLPAAWRVPIRALLSADIQVCVGGGYLRARENLTSTILLGLLLHQIWLGWALGTPTYLCAQSFGPYPWRLQRILAKAVLPKADLILVREAKSRAVLSGLGIGSARVVQVADTAFSFQPDPWPDADALIGRLWPEEQVVGITVRSWLSGAEQHAYECAVAEFVDRITKSYGMRVVIIPQVTATDQNDDDRAVGERIGLLLGPKSNVVVVTRRLTHYEIKSVFDRLTYLVGTRFHSVIFALTSGVPAIAIEYEHKTSGIMQDLGLEKWVLRIEDVTTKNLGALFDELVATRTSYVRHLDKVIPDYIEDSERAGVLIKRSYENLATCR